MIQRVIASREFWQAAIGLSSLSAIGVGLWWERPSVALVVVGSVLLSGITYARTR